MSTAGSRRQIEVLREEIRRRTGQLNALEQALAAAKKGRTATSEKLDGARVRLVDQVNEIAHAHRNEPLVTSATRRIIDDDPGITSAFGKARTAINEGFKKIITMIIKALEALSKEIDDKKRELLLAELQGPDAGSDSTGQTGSAQGGPSSGGGGSGGGGGGGSSGSG